MKKNKIKMFLKTLNRHNWLSKCAIEPEWPTLNLLSSSPLASSIFSLTATKADIFESPIKATFF